MPSRLHNRQTGPMYRAKSYLPCFGQVRFTGVGRPSSRFKGPLVRDPAACFYTLRFFGGRQPLCGIGVRSLIERTSKPAVASARTADSRPAPGPATLTSTLRKPDSFALLAAVSDACWAAKGVPLRDPRKPSEPELDHAITFPIGSVTVMMVLLNDACTWTRPTGTDFFSFFLKVFFLPVFAGAFAI